MSTHLSPALKALLPVDANSHTRSFWKWVAFFATLMLTFEVCASQLSLAWNASPSASVAGYNVHYGTSSGTYTVTTDVGNTLSTTVLKLTGGNTYYFAVTAYDAVGQQSAYSNEASGLAPEDTPVAAFNTSSASGTAPLAITFTNTSTCPATCSYAWTFGDGTTSTAASPSKTYNAAGTYTVTLKVTGSSATATNSISKTITVTAATTAPVAAFTPSTTSGVAPLAITFTNTSTCPATCSYAWTFGDGTTSTAASPSKTYNTAGTYTVTLKVTGSSATATNSISKTITVSAAATAPVAAFTPSTTSGVAPVAVTFTNNSTGTIASYAWSFGDGTTSTAASPSKTYNSAGTYTVTLKVTGNSSSLSSSASKTIVVTAPSSSTSTTAQSLWSSTATPANLSAQDTEPATLAVKFKANKAGYISGIKFYKGPSNSGTHIGALWSSAGKLLASATFTNETTSGWQTVKFTTPVAITGGSVYIASYFAPNGGYSFDPQYFASAGRKNGALYALRNGESGPNGVYARESKLAFPTLTYNPANYWVDVVFIAK
jgi:PKD repeat protein